MKIGLLALISFLLVMPGAAVRGAAQEAAKDSPSAVAAKQIIQELVAGQFEKVEAILRCAHGGGAAAGKARGRLAGLEQASRRFSGDHQHGDFAGAGTAGGEDVVQVRKLAVGRHRGFQSRRKTRGIEFPSASGADGTLESTGLCQAGFVQRAAAHFGERKIRIARDSDGAGGRRTISSGGAGAGFRPARIRTKRSARTNHSRIWRGDSPHAASWCSVIPSARKNIPCKAATIRCG